MKTRFGIKKNRKNKYFSVVTLLTGGVCFLFFGKISFAQINQSQNQPKLCEKEIIINEIHPFASEFVELKNIGQENCSLGGWSITDSRDDLNSHRKIFLNEEIILAGGYYVFEENLYLNDSSADSVKLFNFEKEKIQQVDYDKAVLQKSYNFYENFWKWENPTPGLENLKKEEVVTNDSLKVVLKIDKDIYRNIYADFEVVANEEDFGVIWDFGDGHKSYKTKTNHKYEETGKYQISVKVSGQSQIIFKEMEVEVEKFPNLKVRIVEINPNPIGDDSEQETIVLENKSRKKINLKGWSIASGSSLEKLTNHPIQNNLKIKGGEKITIDREDSAFSLGNQKTHLELRYPDGRVCDVVKYKSEKSLAEGAIYRQNENKKWFWDLNFFQENFSTVEFGDGEIKKSFGFGQEEDALETISLILDELERDLVDFYAKDEREDLIKKNIKNFIQEDKIEIGKKSIQKKEVIWSKNDEEKTVQNSSTGKDYSKILKTKKEIKIENNQIKFTKSSQKNSHWVVVFWQNFFDQANAKINSLLNKKEYNNWE